LRLLPGAGGAALSERGVRILPATAQKRRTARTARRRRKIGHVLFRRRRQDAHRRAERIHLAYVEQRSPVARRAQRGPRAAQRAVPRSTRPEAKSSGARRPLEPDSFGFQPASTRRKEPEPVP